MGPCSKAEQVRSQPAHSRGRRPSPCPAPLGNKAPLGQGQMRLLPGKAQGSRGAQAAGTNSLSEAWEDCSPATLKSAHRAWTGPGAWRQTRDVPALLRRRICGTATEPREVAGPQVSELNSSVLGWRALFLMGPPVLEALRVLISGGRGRGQMHRRESSARDARRRPPPLTVPGLQPRHGRRCPGRPTQRAFPKDRVCPHPRKRLQPGVCTLSRALGPAMLSYTQARAPHGEPISPSPGSPLHHNPGPGRYPQADPQPCCGRFQQWPRAAPCQTETSLEKARCPPGVTERRVPLLKAPAAGQPTPADSPHQPTHHGTAPNPPESTHSFPAARPKKFQE